MGFTERWLVVIKVLHLLPMNKLSGAERMGLLICKHMTDVESFVVTGGADLAEVFQKEGIHATPLNFSIKQLPQLTQQLKQLINQHQIDLVHAHDNIASLAAYLTKKRYKLNVKVVSHIHNCYPWLEGNGVHKKIDQWIRPKYDYNIACGQIVYDYYEQYAPYFNKEKTSVLSNAIDLGTLGKTSQSKLIELRKTFKLSSDKTIIGYIGRLSEQKGMIPFIKELAKHKEQFEDCQFLIVGSGEQEEEVKQLVKALGLESLFIFTGFQAEVYPFYQLINIFFLPSLYEGLPMVLLEAVGSGVPTVSMNVGSISEVIIDNKTGCLIESGDRQQFIKQLIELKDTPLKCQLLSESGKQHVKEKFSLMKYNQTLSAVYISLLG